MVVWWWPTLSSAVTCADKPLMPLILHWIENQCDGLCVSVCVCNVYKLTVYPLVSYRNWASACHATSALFLTASTHAVQCMSVQSSNQLHSIYPPTVAQTHPQWIPPELDWEQRGGKNGREFLVSTTKIDKIKLIVNFVTDQVNCEHRPQSFVGKSKYFLLFLTAVQKASILPWYVTYNVFLKILQNCLIRFAADGAWVYMVRYRYGYVLFNKFDEAALQSFLTKKECVARTCTPHDSKNRLQSQFSFKM